MKVLVEINGIDNPLHFHTYMQNGNKTVYKVCKTIHNIFNNRVDRETRKGVYLSEYEERRLFKQTVEAYLFDSDKFEEFAKKVVNDETGHDMDTTIE